MTSYFTISDPYDDFEDDLNRLIEVLRTPPRLETLVPPPTRARKPGKGCGAGKERVATPLADSLVSAADVIGKIADSTQFGVAKTDTTHVPS